MTATSTSPTTQPKPGQTESPHRRSLSDALGGHRNSFGLLRLVLAASVILSHAFPLGGWGEDPTLNITKGQESIGGFAVIGFFAISGYLIAKSGAATDVVQFLWRRVLRIFPAFWAVLLVGACIVGPVIWSLEGNSFRGYISLSPGGPFRYVVSNWDLVMRQWGIFDIFANSTPYGHIVKMSVFNGSLWTLTYEWGCYLIIAALVLFGLMKRARFLILILTLFYYIAEAANLAVPGSSHLLSPLLADQYRVSLPLIFMIGACLAMYSKEIPFDNRLGIFSGVVVVFTLANGGWVLLGYPALAYFLMWAAASLPQRLQWIGAKNDYSYGMYVYGFLVLQVTAYFGWFKWGYLPWVLATLVITAGCAWLSWHVVEKRALALRDWGPGRGVRYWWQKGYAFVDQHRLGAKTPDFEATPTAIVEATSVTSVGLPET
jgi:peptidoglycan/LPS O-acetylase OafA/YrhL